MLSRNLLTYNISKCSLEVYIEQNSKRPGRCYIRIKISALLHRTCTASFWTKQNGQNRIAFLLRVLVRTSSFLDRSVSKTKMSVASPFGANSTRLDSFIDNQPQSILHPCQKNEKKKLARQWGFSHMDYLHAGTPSCTSPFGYRYSFQQTFHLIKEKPSL